MSSKSKKKNKNKSRKKEKRGDLTGQEEKDVKKQHMIFHLLNTDGSGEISFAEMAVLEDTEGYDLNADDIKRAVNEMDTDGSKEVGFDVFQLWLEEKGTLAQRLWDQSNEKLLREQESRVHLAPMAMTSNGVLIGGHVVDKAEWATIRACRCVQGGRWYYEVLLGDGAACHIGFACTDTMPEPVEGDEDVEPRSKSPGRGVAQGPSYALGDVDAPGSSWGYDGSQGVKMHKGPLPYAVKSQWKANDVVGCILDLDARTIAYTLNGTQLGVAFRAVTPLGDESIFPAMTLQGGPHWARFSRHELQHIPKDCRLFSTSLPYDEVEDRREAKIRRRAFRRARLRAEDMKPAWVEPIKFTAESLVGQRIDMKGRGRGKVDKLNTRGKHELAFDDGSQLSTALGKAGFSVLDSEFLRSYCNEVMADREKQLFEQRINQMLKKNAKYAAKQKGKDKKDSAAGEVLVFTNPLDSFDGDDVEEGGESPRGDAEEEEEEEEEEEDEDLMEVRGEFEEGEGDYGGDDSKKKKKKGGEKKLETEKNRETKATYGNKSPKKGEGGAEAAMLTSGDEDSVDEDSVGEVVEDMTLAPFFETLLKSREVKATAAIDGRKLAFKQHGAWSEPPASESADAITPLGYVGQTVKYEKKGIGVVQDFLDDKKQRHSVEFQGQKGKPVKVSKVELSTAAAAEGLFLVLDEDFVERYISQHVEQATAEFSKAAAIQILRDKSVRDYVDVKALRDAERKRKAALAKPILLAPGIVAAKTVNTVVPLAGRMGFVAMRGAFAATVAVTGTALKATSVLAKVSEPGVNQIETQMGLLSARQIAALCERLDVDGTTLIGRVELAKIDMLLEEPLSDEEINSMVLEVTGDEEGSEGVEYEAFGRWINSAGPIQDRLRPQAKGDLKEEVDWVADARTLTEQVARLRACRQDEAWVDGTSLRPKDIVGLPVDIPPYGQGIVESYSQPGKRKRKKKGTEDGHTILFDIGEHKTIQLEFGGDKHLDERLWKAVQYEYVNDYVDAALAKFDSQSRKMRDEVSNDAMSKVMGEELAWKPGDFNAEGGMYVGRYVQMGGSKRGYCEQFKSGKYTIKPANGGEGYKIKLDGTGKITGKGKKDKKKEIFESFRVLDDEFSVAFTVPLIQQQMNAWSHKQISSLNEEQAQFTEDHEAEVANQLDRYIEETAQQNLIAAATCVAHWSKVGTLGFKTFRVSFMPTAEAMDPEMTAAAGGIEVILRRTWVTMARSDRAIVENQVRKKQGGGGAKDLKGFALGQGEVEQYQVYKKTKMRRDFITNPDAKKDYDLVYTFTVGEKVTALERRVNEAGTLRIRCEIEITDEKTEEHSKYTYYHHQNSQFREVSDRLSVIAVVLQGWVSVTTAAGEDLLVPAEGHALQQVKDGTTMDLRDLDIICAIPEGLTDAEMGEVYHQLHTNEAHPEIALDLFAKWVVSKHSEVAGKILATAKGLKWAELAPLITYVNPDEEPEVAEERYAKSKALAKGGFVIGSFAVKAGIKTTKIAYKVARPITKVALKSTGPIAKTTLKATQVVTNALDVTVTNYGRAGSAMFASLDNALYADFTDVDEAARAAFSMIDESNSRFLRRKDFNRVEEYSGLRFSTLQLDDMFTDILGKAPPEESDDSGAGAEVTGRGLAPKKKQAGISKNTWTSWYSSDSMYANRLRRESLWAIDREKAEAACNHRSRLVESTALDALDQAPAWLSQTDFDEVDPHNMVGLTVEVKGKGKGRGWVQAYGKKGHEILRENEEIFYVNLSDQKDKKLKFKVLSQEFYDNYIFNSLEDTMVDWEEEYDIEAAAAAESDSEARGSVSESETSADAMQNSSTDGAVVAAVEEEEEDTGGKGKKGKKNKKKPKKKADETAAVSAPAEAAAQQAQAEADAEADESGRLTAAQGVVTREDLNQLGALMGLALTKRELDKAMVQMDPTFVHVEEVFDDGDNGGDGCPPSSPRARPKAKAFIVPGQEGRIPFKVFNAWFAEKDVDTGEPLEYTDENPRSDVLARIKLAKNVMEEKATATKLNRLKSIGNSSGMSVDDPPLPSEMEMALFEVLDDNLIGEFNWDEFTYLPAAAEVELTGEELEEAWAALDPKDTGAVTQQTFSRWYNSDNAISDKVEKDGNGALNALGIVYRDAREVASRTGVTSKMLKSADVGNISAVMRKSTARMLGSADGKQPKRAPRIIYKEDVEAAARAKAAVSALVHEDAWRDGMTVLSEIDREDLVGMRIDVETFGKGSVVSCGKGRQFMVQFDPGTPLGKKKIAVKGTPTKLKLPNKKHVFTVLSEDFVSSYMDQQINKAIHRWATHESKIRSKVDSAARAKVMAKKGAWTAGDTIEDPEDILDRRIIIKGYGQGTTVDYDDESANEEKGKWGEHMIEFDSGKTSSLRLDASAGLKYKVLNDKYVEALCKAELKSWQDGRRRLTETEAALKEPEDAEQAKSGKLMQLRDVKNKIQGGSKDMMTSAERQEALDKQLRTLKEIFDRFDHDVDGKLDRDEFDNLTAEIGFQGTNTQLDDAWGEVDESEKGYATFKDLSDFFQSDLLTTIAGASLRNQIATRIVDYSQDAILLHRLFFKHDESHSGHLDFDEFTKLSNSLSFQGTEAELRASYNEIDSSGTGFIEFEEFRAFFMQNDVNLGDSAGILLEMMKEQLDAEKIDGDTLRRVFAKHDPDGNGYLDNFEFDVLVQELGYNGTEEDMADLFKQMDADNNGLIDWEEFVSYFGATAKVDGAAGKVAADLRRNLFTKFTETSLDLRDLRTIFDKVDKKLVGKISVKQFGQAAKNLGWTGSQAELDESFMLADADSTGQLSWNEFREWYMAKNPDAVALMMRDMEGHDEMAQGHIRDFFNAHDSDGNGQLSRGEFIGMARKLGLESDNSELKHMFKVMDLDKSGTIEFDEFVSWYEDNTDGEMLKRVKGVIGNDKKSVRQRQILKTMFQRVDVDGSGEVDAAEILALALDLGVQITLQEMQLIFGEIDLDGSGEISFDEFSQWYLLKGGRGDVLRQRLRAWYKQIDSSSDADVVNVNFEKGRGLQGTKRVKGKVTYFFSRISGAYSEISSFAEQQLTPAEKTGFSTIDKLVFLHQTQLFHTMELANVLRVAQVCEQINLDEGEVLYEDGDEGHAAYFIMNGSMMNVTSGVEVMVSNNDKPFGEQSLLSPHKRAGSMVAVEDTTLLCLFQVDMARLFKAKLVDENSFMHALGGLVVGSLRSNYARLEEASASGTVGQDLALEVARAGWTYDTADFVYAKKSKSKIQLQGAHGGPHSHLDERIRGLMKEKALNATILGAHSYSTVEKVILLKQCTIFATASDHALRDVAALVKMIKVPRGVLLYKEGELGFDSFVVCSGQVKLTRNGNLIGLREKGSINGATCLISAGDPRSATVTTTKETLLMNITYDDFDVVMQMEPELRKGMMEVLMDRLADSYQRLNAVRRLEGRVGYFHEYQKELRLDVRNLRLNAPKPEDYRSFIDERDATAAEGGGDGTQENPVFDAGEKKVFLSQP